MQLTDDDFRRLVDVASDDASSAPPPTTDERRRAPRVIIGARVHIEPIVAGTFKGARSNSAVVRDVSKDGVSILLSDKMEIGAAFRVRFNRAPGQPALTVCCRTVRCDAGGSGGAMFVIAANFTAVEEPGRSASLDGKASMS